MSKSQLIANRALMTLVVEAHDHKIPITELIAEMVTQALISDDASPIHVHWIEFHKLLEQKLREYSGVR